MNALVIGGTSGIGHALVQQLATGGHSVFACSRNEPDSPVDGVTYFTADVVKDGLPTDDLPQELHAVAYCPGTINLKPFQSLDIELFRKEYEINVLGAVQSLQAVLKPLKKAKGASVVLFSTVAATVGLPFHSSVAAAKSAVEGLSKSLAAELAKNKVRVNCVAPSITDTRLATDLLKSDKQRENSAKRHPLSRVGQPEDMARAAYFLLNPENDWITGQTIHVDGGMSSLRPL